MTRPQAKYKDRLFRAIFGKEENKHFTLSLYNGINGTNYTDVKALELITIENVIYMSIKNDLSFLIDDQLSLYEQQSTYNPNMAIRGFMYYAQLYQMIISKCKTSIYSSRLIKLPSPCFIVFYNGSDKKLDDKTYLRLSGSFIKPQKGNFYEWTATMLNINEGHNQKLLSNCKPLNDYATYINRIKHNIQKGIKKELAINEALDYAIKCNMLDGYFEQKKMEVLGMSLTEFDQQEYDKMIRKEAWEDGVSQGLSQGLLQGISQNTNNVISNMLKLGRFSQEDIASAVGLPVSKVQEIAISMKK